jgi:predicted nucleic acid-binding protein
MIHSVRFIAVLDTNVIYPVVIRDLLFWFAHYDLYTPKWSKRIFIEWERVMERKVVSKDEIQRRLQVANKAFPDALVNNYEGLLKTLELPDPDDCHVLAAAIKTNANVIVTSNLKDFPGNYIESFGLKVKSADDFLTDIIDLNPDEAVKAFKEMVLNKKKPELDEYHVLDMLRNSGLNDTANYLHALL